MKMLQRPKHVVEWPADVAQIRAAMRKRGVDAADADIAWAYAEFSEDEYSAGWLLLDVVGIDKAAEKVIARLEDAT